MDVFRWDEDILEEVIYTNNYVSDWNCNAEPVSRFNYIRDYDFSVDWDYKPKKIVKREDKYLL